MFQRFGIRVTINDDRANAISGLVIPNFERSGSSSRNKYSVKSTTIVRSDRYANVD